jgi:hypothetical protein
VQGAVQLAVAAAAEPLPRRWPEEAGTGATPASRAKAASERTRPRCDQATISCAATIGPTPGSSSSAGARSSSADELERRSRPQRSTPADGKRAQLVAEPVGGGDDHAAQLHECLAAYVDRAAPSDQ